MDIVQTVLDFVRNLLGFLGEFKAAGIIEMVSQMLGGIL